MAIDFNLILYGLGIVLLLAFIVDPLFVLLLGAAVFEYKLRKQLPASRLKGYRLFKFAIIHACPNVRKNARCGAACQVLYCAAYIALIMLALFTTLHNRPPPYFEWSVLSLLVVLSVFIGLAWLFAQLLWQR